MRAPRVLPGGRLDAQVDNLIPTRALRALRSFGSLDLFGSFPVNEDKATRYHRLRRRASLAGTALAAAWLLLLLLTGWSASLRDVAMSMASHSFVLAVVCYVVLVAVLTEVVQLPLAFYQGLVLERQYDLSTQTTGRWWLDRLKADGVGTRVRDRRCARRLVPLAMDSGALVARCLTVLRVLPRAPRAGRACASAPRVLHVQAAAAPNAE